jgi:hypothetical protein
VDLSTVGSFTSSFGRAYRISLRVSVAPRRPGDNRFSV